MTKNKESSNEGKASADTEEKTASRKIEGNLPYTTSIGVFNGIVEKALNAARPDKFSADFIDKVLGYSGGSARAAIPIFKKLGFLDSAGTPTELYTQFRSERTRGTAALVALKNAFGDIFKRSEYAHKADENQLRDLISEVTGLPSNDTIVKYIFNTFETIKKYVDEDTKAPSKPDKETQNEQSKNTDLELNNMNSNLGLSYHINIVLPETSDITVFNAIFKSLKSNLL